MDKLIPLLVTADIKVMMYTLGIDINLQYKNMEIVAFGKNEEMKQYILFVMT